MHFENNEKHPLYLKKKKKEKGKENHPMPLTEYSVGNKNDIITPLFRFITLLRVSTQQTTQLAGHVSVQKHTGEKLFLIFELESRYFGSESLSICKLKNLTI